MKSFLHKNISSKNDSSSKIIEKIFFENDFNEIFCSRRYSGLARNLIRCIISPNQDDLSYPSVPPFPGSRNWVSCQTQSLWLENAGQCRRHTGRSLIAAAALAHGGTYLIYGFLASNISQTKESQLNMN